MLDDGGDRDDLGPLLAGGNETLATENAKSALPAASSCRPDVSPGSTIVRSIPASAK